MSPITDMAAEWIDPDAEVGPVFRIGPDLAVRDGERTLRIRAQATPNAAYRCALEGAISDLVERWGGSIELILDFEGRGPPQPGQALGMCRSLAASGHVDRITLIQKPWMPASLVAAILSLIRASGTPVYVRESP